MKIEEFDVQAMVNDIQKENGTISEVYFVACGGSLIDLYSSNYFVNKEKYWLRKSGDAPCLS